jgi:hypothetical protein
MCLPTKRYDHKHSEDCLAKTLKLIAHYGLKHCMRAYKALSRCDMPSSFGHGIKNKTLAQAPLFFHKTENLRARLRSPAYNFGIV